MSYGRWARHSLGNSPWDQMLGDVEVDAAGRKLVAERRAMSWRECWDSMDGKGWSCCLYLLLFTPLAHAVSGAAWPACSAAFSFPLHLGCRVVSLGRTENCLLWLPPLSVHLSVHHCSLSICPEELETHLHIQLSRKYMKGRLSGGDCPHLCSLMAVQGPGNTAFKFLSVFM